MRYILWDYDASNLVDDLPTEDAALAEVAAQIEAFGRDSVETWMLLANDGGGTRDGVRRIAYGAELADLATSARVSVAD